MQGERKGEGEVEVTEGRGRGGGRREGLCWELWYLLYLLASMPPHCLTMYSVSRWIEVTASQRANDMTNRTTNAEVDTHTCHKQPDTE
jgi:hypothetical protein